MAAPQDSMEIFLDFMARKGLNITAQRKLIAKNFFESIGHFSQEEFYQLVSQQDASIGQTTVYRTLKLLCDASLATEIQFADNITRFEIARPHSHHDHMICISCGKIIEILDPRIENLQKEIAAAHDFELTGHSHNLYGFCRQCAIENRKQQDI